MPEIIDLFAGAGGLSLGATRAGFRVAAAVEFDDYAFETHAKNFPGTAHLKNDISTLDGKQLLKLAGLRKGQLDGLIGGPPCQGFSYMGKRDIEDSRNDLFVHFFRLVHETKPAFYVAENVPGILDAQYEPIRQAAFAQLHRTYVHLPPLEIRADHYGAPTTRTRIFFIGFDPKRFGKPLTEADFGPPLHKTSTVVKTALKGLPRDIDPNWLTEESGWRSIGKLGESSFFERVANCIPQGVGDPYAVDKYRSGGKVSGCMGTRHRDDVIERFKALAYGETDKISRAVRLDPDGYCPTLRAGTGKEKGSFQAVRPIHHKAPRVITPREAARLQGFPDWFVFHHTKWQSFRQIGNSVSPLVAEAVLMKVFHNLK